MLHCLAYGNSDQASFRNLEVRDCFDILTVPSTIASYYSDATAAFVLSSGLQYMIEPRTPLFQELLRDPRASHFTLASFMGHSVDSHLNDSVDAGVDVYFPSDFYSEDVCSEVVLSMVDFQRQYRGRAVEVAAKLDRYRKLSAKATGEAPTMSLYDDLRGPTYVLCPYFAVRSFLDEWWLVMERIWEAALQLDTPQEISPVVSMSDVSLLESAIERVPHGMSSRVFYWIPGFDERQVDVRRLRQLRRVIGSLGETYRLMNLYGGYYSILMGKFGLDGFNNGLGYSESREWPTLEATGAAPARYYVRKLHAYVPTTTATAIIENDEAFMCDCSVCGERRLPIDLNYHELKRHFALSRAWEIERSEEFDLAELRTMLMDDADRCRELQRRLPRSIRIRSEHLARWAEALER